MYLSLYVDIIEKDLMIKWDIFAEFFSTKDRLCSQNFFIIFAYKWK